MGTFEPDTAQDQAGHLMALNPDRTASLNIVYFNGFQGQYPLTGINPNAATAQTSMGSIVWKDFAMLGVWKDCNGDGYVGLGDQGVFDYRAELMVGPLNLGICDAKPVPDPIPTDWMPVHNDGKWVREFLPIQWSDWRGDSYRFDINDNSSRVWADQGLPTDDLSSGAAGCWINKQPRDTWHGTGGLVEWLDCHDGWHVTDLIDAAASTDPALSPISFADAPRNQSGSHSVLNIRPWGDEQDGSYVDAWDCSQPPLVQARDPTAPQGGPGLLHGTGPTPDPAGALGDNEVNLTSRDGYITYANVSSPSLSPSTSTTGSPSGSANSTASGLDRCARRTDAPGSTGSTAANAPYANEGDVKNSPAKFETFPFSTIAFGATGDLLRTGKPAVDPVVGGAVNQTVGGEESIFFGVAQGGAAGNGFWFETPNFVGPEITPGESNYWTYYAFVSPGAVAKYNLILPGGSATSSYGAETCGSHTTGVYKGWDCDKTNWYRDAAGADVHPTDTTLGPCHAGQDRCDVNAPCNVGSSGCVSIAIYPQSPYNLRDVDCYDDANLATRAAHVDLVGIRNSIQPGQSRSCDWAH